MALQFSLAIRNARLNVIESTVGTAPVLEMRTGVVPGNCAAADAGTVVATLSLPTDWMADASAGAKALLGLWQDLAADAAGTCGHFRIKQGGTCHIQGSVSATGGGGDMTVDNPVLALGQLFSVTGFTINEPNG